MSCNSSTMRKESWPEFASNSTLHGLRYAVGVSSWPRRVFWIFCMLAAAGGYVHFVRQSIQEYVSKPINTHVSYEEPEHGMRLPAITICNLNAVMRSKANIGYDDQRFTKMKLNLSACDTIRNVSGNLTCGQALICAYHDYGPDIVENCDDKMVEKLRNALNTSSRVFDPEEFMRVYGHDMETMMVGYCRFSRHRRCFAKDFKAVMTPKGMCYRFEPKTEDGGLPKVSFPGLEWGFDVALDTQTNESTFGDWSVGFWVVVSQHGEVANRDRGFGVYPGSHTSAVAVPKLIKRLPAPYKPNCSERDLPGYPLYTKDSCVSQCFNNATIALCGCRLLGEPGFPEIKVCSLQDKECTFEAKRKTNFTACWCSVPCKERSFDVRVSYSKYPNQAGVAIVQGKFEVNRSEEYIRNNLVFIQIGLAELAFEMTEQISAYGPSSLFGDIGGNMGLLLGCSLLTVVEFLDYIFVLLLNRVRGSKQTVHDLHQP